MDTIIKVIGYEEARTNFLKAEMEKAQNRMKFWQTKIKKAKNAIAEMEAHDNASNAGWEYNFYKDALDALEKQPKWISVADNPPDGTKYVIAYSKYGGMLIGHVLPMSNGKEYYCETPEDHIYHVTYWMPRPEPPKEGA